ncbi:MULTISPECIES: phosphatidylglycerophosphatase A family protein [unclassified Helicobacter]|uniref:phosphatidylglycerophosphatase A family protein n=1 Tax=unclassified Helicobacter TaxID=2593540 RepID=UPI000CF046C9|nr:MULTISPECIES: phosphatidylglycerophosphatase A [unclassified Helicobacter]
MIRTLFLTLFFSGKSPKAPGTVGSLLALFLGIPIVLYSIETIILLAILIGMIAIKQIDIYETQNKIHDPKEIVIDELVGMWISMGIGSSFGFDYKVAIISFILFRIYDITKISIIGTIDKKVKGGLGVILDDAVAGIIAGFSTLIVLRILELFS